VAVTRRDLGRLNMELVDYVAAWQQLQATLEFASGRLLAGFRLCDSTNNFPGKVTRREKSVNNEVAGGLPCVIVRPALIPGTMTFRVNDRTCLIVLVKTENNGTLQILRQTANQCGLSTPGRGAYTDDNHLLQINLRPCSRAA
jgi:hypothetical protein